MRSVRAQVPLLAGSVATLLNCCKKFSGTVGSNGRILVDIALGTLQKRQSLVLTGYFQSSTTMNCTYTLELVIIH